MIYSRCYSVDGWNKRFLGVNVM